MYRQLLSVSICIATLFASGCALVAPKYSASLENVDKLKAASTQSISVGKFDAVPGKGNSNPISVRGSSLTSPYNNSYATYLAEAVKQELSLAGKFAPDAQIEISGAIRKNDIDISGFVTGNGVIEARFVVTRSGKITYDQIKMINDSWGSSFVGAVAIPRAQQRYPVMVQKLLAQLYADPAFMDALK